ncbi:FecR family protein [Parapedobacter deserti]|uniref:FecR family protein n=1 Tax=Parapedobacter deserti TaxID=1912957 RepID=A0ABV7JMC8_9SPHI
MSREHFHQLLKRYLAGQCTKSEEQLLHHWYHMLDKGEHQKENTSSLEALEDALWNKIHQRVNGNGEVETNVTTLTKRSNQTRLWLVAASISALLITSGMMVYLRIACYPIRPSFVSTHTVPDSNVIVVRNETTQHMKVILSDESLVELYPGALLEYPKRFSGKNREVHLVGDAFFAVAASKDNPFWVFHEGMITKVLGTKFKITAPKEGVKGEVIVYSGKVDVFYNVGRENFVRRVLSVPDKILVTTNKKAILLPERLEAAVTENPLPLTGQADVVRQETFRDIPMPTLAKTLSELYGLNVVADDSLAETTFTGNISGIGLFKQLDIICTVTDTQYEVMGTTIILKDKH